ncbi:MAG: malonic semialdehyde reductase [Luteimonas sp.]
MPDSSTREHHDLPALQAPVLDQLFRQARTYNAFTGDVGDALLRQLYDLVKFGPTQSNTCPARFVFVKSADAKAKLGATLDKGNYAKTMSAPCTVIVAYDMAFFDKLPVLVPHTVARGWFSDSPEADLYRAALRSSSLQGAYLILAARALGLDCGPMSGFDAAKLDAAFFAGTAIRSNFLVNLGLGEESSLRPRAPRLDFDEACRIL